MTTLEAQRRAPDADEFENRQARVGAYYFLYPFAAGLVVFPVAALLLAPSNLKVPVIGLALVWFGAGLGWALWWGRVLAYRVVITASGLALTHPWGAPSQVGWLDVARIRQQGKMLFVYRPAGRQIRIPDDGEFAQRVIDTARSRGVTIDPPKPA